MSQPQYTIDQVEAMTNKELAEELRSWAAARESVNPRRVKKGQERLDSLLLEEAANRLEEGH